MTTLHPDREAVPVQLPAQQPARPAELVRWRPATLQRRPVPDPPRRRRRLHRPDLGDCLIALAYTLAGAAVTAVAWAVVELVQAVIVLVATVAHWVAGHWPLIVLGVVGLALLLAGGGSRCAGLHCGGCRR